MGIGGLLHANRQRSTNMMSRVDLCAIDRFPPCQYCERLREIKRGSDQTFQPGADRYEISDTTEEYEMLREFDATSELDSEFPRPFPGADQSLVQSSERPLNIMLRIDSSEAEHGFTDRTVDNVEEPIWIDEDSSITVVTARENWFCSSCTCNAVRLCELLLQIPLQQIIRSALSLQIALQLYEVVQSKNTDQSSTKRRSYDESLYDAHAGDQLRGDRNEADYMISPQAKKQRVERRSDTSATMWETLPQELEDKVLANLGMQELYRARTVCKSFNLSIHRESFRHARGVVLTSSKDSTSSTAKCCCPLSEGSFSPIVFFANDLGTWEWSGYDLNLHEWRKLPTLSCLPSPDRRALKNFFVAGGDGLLCINVANPFECPFEKLIVCNPLTQSTLELPPLNFRRHPVLMHVVVNHATNSFMILVAGSSCMGSEHLCRKTEVYDSLTSSWEVVADLPGPEFALNEYQVGVNSDGIIYCIALIFSGTQRDQAAAADHDPEYHNIAADAPLHCSKGLLAYSLKEKTWSSLNSSSCILPRVKADATFVTTQLLECSGSIYLFSEQELCGNCVHFCIAKLELGPKWTVIVDEKRKGYSRGLLVYPEYICLPHGEGKLCVFNALKHTVVVYDLNSNTRESLPPPPFRHGTDFSKLHTLNPLAFVFRPSFQTPI